MSDERAKEAEGDKGSGSLARGAGLHETPSADRTHIGFFGKRNAGKSSLVNAVTGQDLAVVSEVAGTTTDPVSKAMEILPLGPVVVIDTPGYDDDDERLGEARVRRATRVLAKADIAVLVIDAAVGMSERDREMLALIEERKLPHLLVFTKADMLPEGSGVYARPERTASGELAPLYVSAATGEGIGELRSRLGSLGVPQSERPIVRDLLKPGDLVVLVTPIDESAPKGRLILPQVQTLRDVLDAGAMALTVKESELTQALAKLGEPPALVITDSQAFAEVARIVPEDIPLTSFSILFARRKGFLEQAVAGVAALDRLREGDTVLVAEGCTHDRKCNDIATVKIPAWLEQATGGTVRIETATGLDFPEDMDSVRTVLHCGGCMLTPREIARRREVCEAAGVPMTNYGLAIAHIHGVLRRSLGIFPELQARLDVAI